MHRAWPVLILLACAPTSTDGTDDTDTDGADTDVDTDLVEDTEIAWDTGDGSDGPGPGDDTGVLPYVFDPDIGTTALDGTWTGSFVYLDVWPDILVKEDPRCEGTVELVIDGKADRHVMAEMRCDTWDPNFKMGALPAALAGPYGDLEGIGFATLDPADLTEFRLDVSIVATNMSPFARKVRIRAIDDTLVMDFDNVSVGTGQRVSFTATRASTP